MLSNQCLLKTTPFSTENICFLAKLVPRWMVFSFHLFSTLVNRKSGVRNQLLQKNLSFNGKRIEPKCNTFGSNFRPLYIWFGEHKDYAVRRSYQLRVRIWYAIFPVTGFVSEALGSLILRLAILRSTPFQSGHSESVAFIITATMLQLWKLLCKLDGFLRFMSIII